MNDISLLTPRVAPAPRTDKTLRIGIIGMGALCFVLLAWGHLGLGALVFPPAPAPATMTAQSGAARATLTLPASQIIVGAGTVVTLQLRDAAGQPVTDATVAATATMVGMPMAAPPVIVQNLGGGRFQLRLALPMAGDWRLAVNFRSSHAGDGQLSFTFGARWR